MKLLLCALGLLCLQVSGSPVAPQFAPTHLSVSAEVERAEKSKEGESVKTTRQIKVHIRNMSQTQESKVGVDCWMFYRDLATDKIVVQTQERTVWTLAPGKTGDVVAAKSLFHYTPTHFKRAGGRGLRARFHKVEATGHKYYGYLVRLHENGQLINELSSTYGFTSSASLPGLADKSPFLAGKSGRKPKVKAGPTKVTAKKNS